jgi:hypothetical protein
MHISNNYYTITHVFAVSAYPYFWKTSYQCIPILVSAYLLPCNVAACYQERRNELVLMVSCDSLEFQIKNWDMTIIELCKTRTRLEKALEYDETFACQQGLHLANAYRRYLLNMVPRPRLLVSRTM